tara:strand:+ start:4347 stop:5537 length:1191 start_codon:yes stop_codon:yes gene_type:complete
MDNLISENKPKLIRTSTVAISLDYLLKGQLKFLNNHYEVLAASGTDAHLENVFLREGVRVVNVPMQRDISPIKDLITLWKLYLLFCNEKPKIVHSITPKAGLLSMTAAYFARVPIRVHTFTGLIFPTKTGIFQKLLILMDKLLCFFATNIYPEGEGVKNDLTNYKITKKPLRIIANGNVNGVDINFFDSKLFNNEKKTLLRRSLAINASNFVFIFVGRLVGDKGINELVVAFKKLQTTSSLPFQLSLILVGPLEPLLDPLKPKTLKEINNNKNIISVGFKSDIRPYLSISDILVFPSHREGFPNVVLQAGAMGLPCIVSDINGCNEIIEEGKNGWIIPVKDENAILNSMRNCILDINKTTIKKSNIRNIIENRFQQEIVWQALLKEYKLLEKNIIK